MPFFYKRGAMFGLDARIALAIFGALSVISGAALYSAIQTAKAEKFRQYFEGLIKASEQYLLDNGKYLPAQNQSETVFYISDLVNNRENLNTWAGPYVQSKTYNTAHITDSIIKSVYSLAYVKLILQQSSTWSSNSLNQDCVSVGHYDCSEAFLFRNDGNLEGEASIKEIFELLDDLVDNNDGELSGKVRYLDYNPGYDALVYMGIPRKRVK